MTELAAWLNELAKSQWSRSGKSKLYRVQLTDIEGLIEVGYSPGSGLITASYAIHSGEFDELVFGRKCDGGILLIQCGMATPPYLSVYTPVEDEAAFLRFCQSIQSESEVFFGALGSLEAVYEELRALGPRFPRADPRATQLRDMHAAVVAYLRQRDWRPDLERAMRAENGLSGKWVAQVATRLKERAASPPPPWP